MCALWGFASAVRVAHSSFPMHRRFVSPRYLHYRRHTQITWEKLGGGTTTTTTEYERFIVLAEFIKMEQSCRCAYVIDLMICDGFMWCVFVFFKKQIHIHRVSFWTTVSKFPNFSENLAHWMSWIHNFSTTAENGF